MIKEGKSHNLLSRLPVRDFVRKNIKYDTEIDPSILNGLIYQHALERGIEKIPWDKAPAYDGILPQLLQFPGFREFIRDRDTELLINGPSEICLNEQTIENLILSVSHALNSNSQLIVAVLIKI